MTTPTILKVELPGVPKHASGKVRDIFDLGEHLLIVTTDRISAYDVVLPNGIPDKGRVLTGLSVHWFRFLGVEHHLVEHDVRKFPAALRPHTAVLEGRSMLVRRAKPYPVECVVRGFLSGSGWREYKTTGEVCGVRLPAGLRESDRLPEPIFTPATKAATGHDENISFARMAGIVGDGLARELRDLALAIYRKAADYAWERGIIIADTKFEFGEWQRRTILIDEVMTPDSSRFWPLSEYKPGGPQPSFDKQFVRDWLDSTGWNHAPPAPELPPEVVAKTSEKYREALTRLTGTAGSSRIRS